MSLDSAKFRISATALMFAVFYSAATSAFGDHLGPLDVLASPNERTLFIALHDANQLGVFDTETDSLTKRIDLPGQPTAMALDRVGEILYVTCAAPQSTVCAVDTVSLNITARYTAGHTASGLAIDDDRQRIFVCNRFDNDVSVIDLASGNEIARVPVIREPCAAVVAPQSGTVFVVNHLPLDPANSFDVAAEVTVIVSNRENRDRFETQSVRLPNGSTSCRDIAISPNGKWAYVTHSLARYQLPATQLERGWMNTNALSLIDVERRALLNTVLLDSVDAGAANPWGVVASDDGTLVCVTHAGSQELTVIDIASLREVLIAAAEGRPAERKKFDGRELAKADDAQNDLALLYGKRRRITLSPSGPYAEIDFHAPDVSGPRGLAMVGGKVYVACYYTDNLAIVNVEQRSNHPARLIALAPPAEMDQARIGEMLFHDARLCFQQWQSCASCHPDGRADGLNWDLLNDGVGNGNNVKSMLWATRTPPMMVSGVRASAEQAVRSGIRHILFTTRSEEDIQAISAYLAAIKPIPSPKLVDGRLSESAERGKRLFLSEKIGCYKCHPEPLYTDQKMHDVASKGDYDDRNDFDTPTLVECWRTAPYMHDGKFTTLGQLLQVGKHGKKGGDIESLSDAEVTDLIEFVLSL
jgi:YVTN family beta-propeller protein